VKPFFKQTTADFQDTANAVEIGNATMGSGPDSGWKQLLHPTLKARKNG